MKCTAAWQAVWLCGLSTVAGKAPVHMLQHFPVIAADRCLLSCPITASHFRLCKCGHKSFSLILFSFLPCSYRFLMPSLQPYGGRGWTLSCLLPPSCISLYANVLLKLESAQRGISRETLHLSVNSQLPFSAATVFQMLLLDIVLYAVLTWYLDQVRPHCLLCTHCLVCTDSLVMLHLSCLKGMCF